MRARNVALAVAAAASARRRLLVAPAFHPRAGDRVVQLGLADGAVHTLDRSDPSTTELETLAAGVRDSLPGGA